MAPIKTKKLLANQVTEFKNNNGFSDLEIAKLLKTTGLQVYQLRRGLRDWIELRLYKNIVMIMGE